MDICLDIYLEICFGIPILMLPIGALSSPTTRHILLLAGLLPDFWIAIWIYI